MQPFLVMAIVLLLAACQASLPGAGGKNDAPNAVMGDAIEVTSLDDPVEGLAAAEAAEPDAVAGPEGADAAADEAEADPAADAAASEAVPEVVPEPEPVDPALLTPEAQACVKKGGRYQTIGRSIARACITPTRDSGDQCKSGRDCDGECLARSQTCAPVTPLFGCNEILQDDGSRVMQCIN